jgi:glutamate decarboxylase
MPLHHVPEEKETPAAPPRYASMLAAHTMPGGRMPERGVPADVAHSLVRDELMLDGNSRQKKTKQRSAA